MNTPSYIKKHYECNVTDCDDRLTDKCLDCINNTKLKSHFKSVSETSDLIKRVEKIEQKVFKG